MAPGIILVIVGAILAFAVRTDASAVDIQTVGLIFMIAGAAIIAYARREKRIREVETRVEQRLDASGQPHTVRETVTHEFMTDEEDLAKTQEHSSHGQVHTHGHTHDLGGQNPSGVRPPMN